MQHIDLVGWGVCVCVRMHACLSPSVPQVVTYQADSSNLINVLFSLGMTSYDVTVQQKNGSSSAPVRILLDGQVVGTANHETVVAIVKQLRLLKTKGMEKVE